MEKMWVKGKLQRQEVGLSSIDHAQSTGAHGIVVTLKTHECDDDSA